jgi:hypothetical protein
MVKKHEEKRIPLSDISKALEEGLAGADQLRAVGLEGLHRVRRVKDSGLKREQKRLTKKLGPEHPRVVRLVQKKEVNQVFARNLTVEIDRAKTEVPGVDENTWVLHGFVRDKHSKGVPNLTVGLYDERGNWIRELGYGCTDKRGYFSIIYHQKGEAKQEISASMKLFLYVSDKEHKILYKDPDPLYLRIGQIDYREIYLTDEEICPPPEPGEEVVPVKPDTWIVKGRVTDEEGRGIGGLTVSIYDKDHVFDDRLGTTLTDDTGNFMASYKSEEFRDLFEARPDIYLKVSDQEGKKLYSSRRKVKCKAGSIESFNIKIKRTTRR